MCEDPPEQLPEAFMTFMSSFLQNIFPLAKSKLENKAKPQTLDVHFHLSTEANLAFVVSRLLCKFTVTFSCRINSWHMWHAHETSSGSGRLLIQSRYLRQVTHVLDKWTDFIPNQKIPIELYYYPKKITVHHFFPCGLFEERDLTFCILFGKKGAPQGVSKSVLSDRHDCKQVLPGKHYRVTESWLWDIHSLRQK